MISVLPAVPDHSIYPILCTTSALEFLKTTVLERVSVMEEASPAKNEVLWPISYKFGSEKEECNVCSPRTRSSL